MSTRHDANIALRHNAHATPVPAARLLRPTGAPTGPVSVTVRLWPPSTTADKAAQLADRYGRIRY